MDSETRHDDGVKISPLCYEHNDGQFYVILTCYGWLAVVMTGNGDGYTYSHMEN